MNALNELIARIRPVDDGVRQQAQQQVDALIKPIGSLGKLEAIAVQLAAIYRTLDWSIGRKKILVMAADHGVFAEQVAISPQSVTALQAYNSTQGLTGVCALASANQTEVDVIDVGINSDPIEGVINLKLNRGSENIARGPAMSREQVETILYRTAEYVQQQVAQGMTVIGVGELGIANTTPAAAIVSVMTATSPSEIVGLGANYPSRKMQHKIAVVERAIEINHPNAADAIDVMAKVGGYDLAGMTGAMLGCAAAGVPVVLDGFLSYASAIVACGIHPAVRDYVIPSHSSAERGSQRALQFLGLEPCLDMNLRLGEGSGAALAMNLLTSAEAMIKQMGRFADDNLDLPNPS